MGYRTIAVELTDDESLKARIGAARSLAKRFDAVLVGVHPMPLPFIPASYLEAGAYLGPDLIEAQRDANRQIKERVREVFQDLCGIGPDVLWQEAEGDWSRILTGAARTSDLIVVRHDLSRRSDAPAVLDQLVSAAGIPVLALPDDATGDLGKAVLVAWDGSREAARAVHDALPFLSGAARVTLCAVGDEAATSLDAASAMVRRHGMSVDARRVSRADADAGEVLLTQAGEMGADLLVMGAYGHARLREFVFGGATRHVLDHAALPVLFSS